MESMHYYPENWHRCNKQWKTEPTEWQAKERNIHFKLLYRNNHAWTYLTNFWKFLHRHARTKFLKRRHSSVHALKLNSPGKRCHLMLSCLMAMELMASTKLLNNEPAIGCIFATMQYKNCSSVPWIPNHCRILENTNNTAPATSFCFSCQ